MEVDVLKEALGLLKQRYQYDGTEKSCKSRGY